MNHLADMLFDLIWSLEFSSEDEIDPDFVSSQLEDVWHTLNELVSDEEKQAFIDAAKRAKSRLLAEPDEHGYTPRSLVTEEQKKFLEELSSGEFE